MSEKSFSELKRIAANQTQTIRQQNEILANQNKEVMIKKQQLEMEKMQYEASKYADIRHQVNQCVDFALKSLPWWNRSPKAVVDKASEFLLTIKKETAKHVAMEMMAQRITEETKADTEKVLDGIIVNTVSTDTNGRTAIHATLKPDRENTEMETL